MQLAQNLCAHQNSLKNLMCVQLCAVTILFSLALHFYIKKLRNERSLSGTQIFALPLVSAIQSKHPEESLMLSICRVALFNAISVRCARRNFFCFLLSILKSLLKIYGVLGLVPYSAHLTPGQMKTMKRTRQSTNAFFAQKRHERKE